MWLTSILNGFFDNISHTKLIRQIWALGIRDKKLLCIIKEMLKAPIVLAEWQENISRQRERRRAAYYHRCLSNIVLNELDWWICFSVGSRCQQGQNSKRGTMHRARRSRAIPTELCAGADLKEMHAVRYADDFKIFCASHEDAVRAYKATELWLKDRLGLEISPDKSKVVNLKRQYSEFLGFKLKVS